MLALRRATPARRPRVRGAVRGRIPASSRALPASLPQEPCAAAPFRRANARDAIRRCASLRNAHAISVSRDTSPATLRRARGPARTTPGAWRARPPSCRAHGMAARIHDERLRRQQCLDLLEQQKSLLAICDQARRGCVRISRALSTSAVRPGYPHRRAARPPVPAPHGLFVRRRRIAIPATTSSWAVRDGGRKGAGSSSASARSASSRRPISSRRRTARYRACAAFTGSPCAFERRPRRVERFDGQPRSRETSAISAWRPRTSRGPPLSFGPKARTARRKRAFARANRRAGPSRCREAPAKAHRRAGQPASMPQGDRPPRAPARRS